MIQDFSMLRGERRSFFCHNKLWKELEEKMNAEKQEMREKNTTTRNNDDTKIRKQLLNALRKLGCELQI